MKRRITELEAKLLEKGYTLIGKHYTGKHSELTYSYDYIKVFNDFRALVSLNSKRNEIIDIQITSVFPMYNKSRIAILKNYYGSVKYELTGEYDE